MAAIKRINIEDIVDYFEELEDPRTDINIKHPLVSVVVIAMMAVLAGANGPTAIAKWAKLKKDFLVQALPLPHGVPCKDVFRAVLSLLKPEAFQKCFAAWLSSLRDSAEEKAAEEGNPIDKPIYGTEQENSASFEREGGATWASGGGLEGTVRTGGAARHAAQRGVTAVRVQWLDAVWRGVVGEAFEASKSGASGIGPPPKGASGSPGALPG